MSGKEVEASDRAATLEEKLTRSEAEKKKIQNNFRAAELTWAQTTRELEGQVEELKVALLIFSPLALKVTFVAARRQRARALPRS